MPNEPVKNTTSSFDCPPFLTWAGGKRWLVAQFPDVFPQEYNRYIEPFLGSAAVFFHLRPKKAILSDANPDLIEAYRAIKNDHVVVETLLRKHQKNHSKDYYYKIRKSRPRTPHTRAARFIYLNRTCWNGLYRVNLSGDFNVPIGTKSSVILPTDDFGAVRTALRGCRLYESDFEAIVDKAQSDDFLFVDPPYTVKHDHNGFLKYNESLFSWRDQIRLRDSVVRAQDRGAIVVMTNANHRSVRDLYRDYFEIYPASRSSVLSGDPAYRGDVKELIVTNWVDA